MAVRSECVTRFQNAATWTDSVKDTQQEKISAYTSEIDRNKKVIRRQDKMIVDLQQRNEVSMQQVAVTQEEVQKKVKQQDNLQVKIQELSD